MSIVINCSDSSRVSKPGNGKSNTNNTSSKSKASGEELNYVNINIGMDNDEDCRMVSDKSIINLPKYLTPKANDLNHKNIDYNTNVDLVDVNLTAQSKRSEIYRHNSSANINTSSFISTGSNNYQTNKTNKKNFVFMGEKGKTEENVSWDKKFTLQTLMEKKICEEINRVEEEKCLDYMDNLNNLSNILKSKTNKISKFQKHNLSSDNLFVYNNIIKSDKNVDLNLIPVDEKNAKTSRGLNNGFIFEENSNSNFNNYNNYKKFSNTVSQGSSQSIRNNEESQTKTDLQRFKVAKKEENEKIQKINQRIESIKNTYTFGNKINKNMMTPPASFKDNRDAVELTCFQKMCGEKK